MNRAYRIVWSAARQAWIVASEKAGCGGRPPLAVKKAATLLLLMGGTLGPQGAMAGNQNNLVISGGSYGVSAGETWTNTSVTSGFLNVSSGGTTSQTSLFMNGIEGVYGGSATSTTVNNGGTQAVVGGTALQTTVNSGGEPKRKWYWFPGYVSHNQSRGRSVCCQ